MSRTSKTRGETLALCRGGAGTKAALLYRMEQADAEKRGGEEPCMCALALGLGIFVAAVFPVGALMFLVAFLLIVCGIGCLRRF